mmetsp:Transcript_24730/g.77746  ORF Transcript_24730/g.77746 Transcript_24730/m.77746 type:complete len:242 (+) Transcript_24730:166-891(+)
MSGRFGSKPTKRSSMQPRCRSRPSRRATAWLPPLVCATCRRPGARARAGTGRAAVASRVTRAPMTARTRTERRARSISCLAHRLRRRGVASMGRAWWRRVGRAAGRKAMARKGLSFGPSRRSADHATSCCGFSTATQRSGASAQPRRNQSWASPPRRRRRMTAVRRRRWHGAEPALQMTCSPSSGGSRPLTLMRLLACQSVSRKTPAPRRRPKRLRYVRVALWPDPSAPSSMRRAAPWRRG